jgi:hypothetical protein
MSDHLGAKIYKFPISVEQRDAQARASTPNFAAEIVDGGAVARIVHLNSDYVWPDETVTIHGTEFIVGTDEEYLDDDKQYSALSLRKTIVVATIGAVLFTGATKFGGEALSKLSGHNSHKNTHHIDK